MHRHAYCLGTGFAIALCRVNGLPLPCAKVLCAKVSFLLQMRRITTRMKFGLRSFIVLLALWVQSVSMVGSWSVAQRVAGFDHSLVHGQNVNHHHHANPSLNLSTNSKPPGSVWWYAVHCCQSGLGGSLPVPG
jgi:hypothetical protein